MQITTHTQLLNALIEKYSLKSYLEIGVQNPANNFDKVKCERKVGVDPTVEGIHVYKMASDDFFEYIKPNPFIFDIVFIDGLHHADQVKRDFENSLRCLSDNGFIVIHDVLPENEEGTIVPRQTKQWWGDVYKWAMTIASYPGIEFITYNIDNGCMVVKKNELKKAGTGFLGECFSDITNYPMYKIHGRTLMNVIDEVTI